MALIIKKTTSATIDGNDEAFKGSDYEGLDFTVEVKPLTTSKNEEIENKHKYYDVRGKEQHKFTAIIKDKLSACLVDTSIQFLDENGKPFPKGSKELIDFIIEENYALALCIVTAANSLSNIQKEVEAKVKN
jgi:hypothetical protein